MDKMHGLIMEGIKLFSFIMTEFLPDTWREERCSEEKMAMGLNVCDSFIDRFGCCLLVEV